MARSNWQLTLGQRLSYSVGMFSASIVTATVMSWVLYFYSPPPNAVDEGMVFLGLALAVGVARLIGSAVDAITNPLVAFWSDRSTNPRGRRIPFVRLGAIPLMLFAILVWFPPVHGTSIWNVVWLAITLSGTWFFYTYVVAPYLALMPEITTDPEERVSLTVSMAYFEAGATLIAALAVPPVIEALRGGLQLGPLFISDGFKFTAILLAVIGGIGFFISVSRVKEKVLPENKQSKLNLKESIVECFRNPSFPPYLLAVSSAKIGIGLVMISMPFLATAVLHKGEGFTAALMAPMFLSILVGFVVAEKFVNRTGLKYAFRLSTLAATFVVFGFLLVFFAGGDKKVLSSVTPTPAGDYVFAFTSGGDQADSPREILGNPEEPHWNQGNTDFVLVTPLEWRGIFYKADLSQFGARIDGMSDAELAACLRSDSAGSRPEGDVRQWLHEQDATTLSRHLTKGCGEANLLVEPKYRFDERIYLKQVGLPEVSAGMLSLNVEIGTVPEPPETFNLQGWSRLFSTPESRAAMTGPAVVSYGPPHPFRFEGEIVYGDGSLVFDGFHRVAGEASSLSADPDGEAAYAQLEKIFPDDARLNNLLSRFDFRLEYSLSTRIFLVLFLCFILGFPASVLMSMYRPIVCEIIDMDEQRVGTRREAIYFGVEGLLTKLADGVSAIVAPVVMVIGHFFMAPPFGYVLPFGAAGLFMLLAFWIFGKYPLGQRVPRI